VSDANLIRAREPGRSRYSVLAEALRTRVLRGEWPPGTAIPAEQTLAAEHGVALGTMRRALQVLVDEGLIERIHGRGTFVRSGMSGSTMLRFFRFASEHDEVPASRIVSRRRGVAPADVARRLGAGRGDEVLHVVRVRSLGGAPCLLEHIWLPLPEFEALAAESPDRWGDLLYPLFASLCGIHVHRAQDEVRFGSLSAAQARHLDLPAGHPCALVTRAAFDLTGRCVEVRATRGDAHAFQYTVTLT
jgi:GntR family transcriptional regulator